MKLVMVDTQTSNLRSVANAFRRIGAEVEVTTRRDDIDSAKAIILPGVGAFEPAISSLGATGLAEAITRRARDDQVPLLGICLGMQLLATRSEENGNHKGLGLIEGTVRRLEPGNTDYRVPNIGWCDVTPTKSGRLFADPSKVDAFYFVHSYYFDCVSSDDVAATIDYAGHPVSVAVERGNIFGLQFHPEKSQDPGLDLLEYVTRTIIEVAA